MLSKRTILNITRTATLLAFFVVVLGAYVRLSDAGLGCPDWPGCYGKLIVPDKEVHIEEIYAERPLEHGKAWKEMIHRYAAGTLGLVIFYLALVSIRQGKITGGPVVMPGTACHIPGTVGNVDGNIAVETSGRHGTFAGRVDTPVVIVLVKP